MKMSTHEITVLFYGSLAGLATLLGIMLIKQTRDWAIKNSNYLNSFAAGLLLALVFLHLLPEATELSEIAPQVIFLGFFGFYVLENFIMIHSGTELRYCIDEEEPHSHMLPTTGIMAFSGLALHSLIDGIIIGVGFEVSTEVGLLAAFAVITHEVPEGITSFALINETHPSKALMLSIIVGIATPIGALLSLLFIHNPGLQLPESTIGILLALGAGTFLYVAASDLIPETHRRNQSLRNLGAFLIGVLLIILISLIE